MGSTFNPRTSIDVVRQLAIGVLVNRRAQETLGRYGQAPDPPAQGETPSQPSRQQVVFYLNPAQYWEEPRIGAKLALQDPFAAYPRGAMIPDDERDNIDRPASSTVAETPDYALIAAAVEPIPGG